MTKPHLCYPDISPVAVGGLGGSGTRLIAQHLKDTGFYIGSLLNEANDNLLFTLLFKRTTILSISDADFDALIDIFVKSMTGETDFTPQQLQLAEHLAAQYANPQIKAWLSAHGNPLLYQVHRHKPDNPWGWKEPNTHITLDRLITRFPKLKYVHVMRNGLDVAYSSNQRQLKLWGKHFLGESVAPTPYYALKFWCIIHQRVLAMAESNPGQFMLLNYDNLCAYPEQEIDKLLGFLSIEPSSAVTKQLAKSVQPPTSIGRFRRHDLGQFAEEDIAFVQFLGFDVRV
ncbi:sulfotransferase family protein [Rhabdochromatium marinum]|uniref:sulfotransferase family protein n=1 Tax=Rhabdochromatium marinum TaxID=48729 RepID=UPI001904D863|nr:sulfotransferase [Rhabdochromatium marinum]MBK1649530.1 hypothetical protein [Rhabdochromatium marinum]